MCLMEHEVMSAPIGAEVAGDKPIKLVDYEDAKTRIDYSLKFGYSLQDFRGQLSHRKDFVLMTDTDTISREAAIDALKELTANGTNKGMISGKDAVHRIEMLPPAQTEQHWIPATKRQPEEYRECLVTYRTGCAGIHGYFGT